MKEQIEQEPTLAELELDRLIEAWMDKQTNIKEEIEHGFDPD